MSPVTRLSNDVTNGQALNNYTADTDAASFLASTNALTAQNQNALNTSRTQLLSLELLRLVNGIPQLVYIPEMYDSASYSVSELAETIYTYQSLSTFGNISQAEYLGPHAVWNMEANIWDGGYEFEEYDALDMLECLYIRVNGGFAASLWGGIEPGNRGSLWRSSGMARRTRYDRIV